MKKVLIVLLSVISVASFAGNRAPQTVNAHLESSPNQIQQQVFAQKFLKATTVKSATSAAITMARVNKIAISSVNTPLVG
ncbi:MAG: hypothetical protein Q8M03_12625 [Legionella sp.]|nr:hypothetical protein [Legionella sp.]